MLKPQEIKALAEKINTDAKTIERGLRDLFSKRETIIDNEVMNENDVLEFLRICLRAKNKKERDRLFYSKFLPKFAKLENQTKTLVYFLRDYFFCALLTYMDALERQNFSEKFDPLSLDTFDIFVFPINLDYLNPGKMKSKKGDIVDTLLSRIIDEIDLVDCGFVFEEDYILSLSIDILEEVGFLSLVSNKIRYCLVDTEEFGNEKELKKVKDALSTKKRESRDRYIFLYCLCEVLRRRGYKAEESYRRISDYMHVPSSTIRTRYFEQKKKFNDTGVLNLIKINNLEYEIGNVIAKIERI